jgi:hypothetical protein
MSPQRQHRRRSPIRRRAALATAVIAALAIAAPVGGASAATPRAAGLSAGLSAWLTELTGQALTEGEFAFGGYGIRDVFNGGTTVVVSTGPAQGNTIGSP